MVEVFSRNIHRIIIDEGASISILSSTTWKSLGSPNLVPTNGQILAFNRITTHPLGIIPQLPILIGEKTVCIDVMVIQGTLDFNLILG